ncbi:MAG: PEP-CTERM sorting domain-containing protein [Methylococcaceae bacterium]
MKKILVVSLLSIVSVSANAATFFNPEQFQTSAATTAISQSTDGSFAGSIHLSTELTDSTQIFYANSPYIESLINFDILSAFVSSFSGYNNFTADIATNGQGVSTSFDFQQDSYQLNAYASNINASGNLLELDINASGNVLLGGAQSVSQVPVPGAVWLFGSGLVALVGKKRKAIAPQLSTAMS